MYRRKHLHKEGVYSLWRPFPRVGELRRLCLFAMKAVDEQTLSIYLSMYLCIWRMDLRLSFCSHCLPLSLQPSVFLERENVSQLSLFLLIFSPALQHARITIQQVNDGRSFLFFRLPCVRTFVLSTDRERSDGGSYVRFVSRALLSCVFRL